jgi:putative ABC transport system substrate-binding protein
MTRREFIALGGAAAAWPRGAQAQQGAMPIIGFIGIDVAGPSAGRLSGFHEGLKETGFIEGQNVAIEYRWAEADYARLPALVAELVSRNVSILFASALPTALAAKAATTTIPVVFVIGADPVDLGLVASLNRPGGNLTGISQLYGHLGGKRLEILRELVPATSLIGILSNPRNQNAETHLKDVQGTAAAMGQQTLVCTAGTEVEIDNAFATLAKQQARALLVADDPFFTHSRAQIIALAARQSLPAIYYAGEFVEAGGLASYGSSPRDSYREAEIYVGKILKGSRPADLPVIQPTKFELVINLKTAKALGLTVPPTLLARADQVIE